MRTRLELFFRERPGELFDELSLIAGQLLRCLDLHGREQIASPASVDIRHALAFQPERGAGLRSLGDLHGFGPVERRHLDVAAKRHRREVDRDLAEQVHPVAPEKLVLVHVDDDVEMTGRTAGGAGLAFTLKAELLPGRDPAGNLDRDFSLARHASRAAAVRARTGDGEEALLETDLAVALALRARARRRSLGRARAVARLAVLLARNLNRRLGAAS